MRHVWREDSSKFNRRCQGLVGPSPHVLAEDFSIELTADWLVVVQSRYDSLVLASAVKPAVTSTGYEAVTPQSHGARAALPIQPATQPQLFEVDSGVLPPLLNETVTSGHRENELVTAGGRGAQWSPATPPG